MVNKSRDDGAGWYCVFTVSVVTGPVTCYLLPDCLLFTSLSTAPHDMCPSRSTTHIEFHVIVRFALQLAVERDGHLCFLGYTDTSMEGWFTSILIGHKIYFPWSVILAVDWRISQESVLEFYTCCIYSMFEIRIFVLSYLYISVLFVGFMKFSWLVSPKLLLATNSCFLENIIVWTSTRSRGWLHLCNLCMMKHFDVSVLHAYSVHLRLGTKQNIHVLSFHPHF